MSIVTYEERVKAIHTPADVEVQIRRAKNYVKELRRKQRQADTLAEKIEINSSVKEAELVLRKLRMNCFDLEDAAVERSC